MLLEDFGSYAGHGPREGIEAKSKGNVVNLLQMTAFLGQQYVPEGRMTSSNSIFSQMEKEFYNVETQGMVEDNFINGLKPINYFLHSVGGRTGIVDTAVRTSDTGYIERRMAKAGENVSTFADLTVRTADEHIVEWNYGDDQLNPQFVQWKLLNILSVDDKEFQKLYVWDNPSAASEEEKKKLMGYRAVITKIRKQLFPYHVKKEVSTPVDLESLFEKICLAQKRPACSPMTVDYIIEKVDQAISSWMETGILVLRGNEDWNKNWWTRRPDRKKEEEKYLSYPLLAYLHEHFHSKILLEKYHFSKEDLEMALQMTERFLFRAKMGMFQQVGTLAHQSITEPCTQLTLTTFYTAGLNQTGIYDLPRMNEILNLLNADQMNHPSMKIPINHEFCECMNIFAERTSTTNGYSSSCTLFKRFNSR